MNQDQIKEGLLQVVQELLEAQTNTEYIVYQMEAMIAKHPSSVTVIEESLANKSFPIRIDGILAGLVLDVKFSQLALEKLFEDGLRTNDPWDIPDLFDSFPLLEDYEEETLAIYRRFH